MFTIRRGVPQTGKDNAGFRLVKIFAVAQLAATLMGIILLSLLND